MYTPKYTETGEPKRIRIYDNGGATVDRYAVIFTHAVQDSRDTGRVYYSVFMSERPFSPQGFGQHDCKPYRYDIPSYKHLGKRITFSDLPPDCQKLVRSDYRELYEGA